MCASIWAPRDVSSRTLGLRRRMDKILFISSWNRAGALATPKGMTFHLNTPVTSHLHSDPCVISSLVMTHFFRCPMDQFFHFAQAPHKSQTRYSLRYTAVMDLEQHPVPS